jgi:hypothetical protein
VQHGSLEGSGEDHTVSSRHTFCVPEHIHKTHLASKGGCALELQRAVQDRHVVGVVRPDSFVVEPHVHRASILRAGDEAEDDQCGTGMATAMRVDRGSAFHNTHATRKEWREGNHRRKDSDAELVHTRSSKAVKGSKGHIGNNDEAGDVGGPTGL